jgi:hypothetical protein
LQTPYPWHVCAGTGSHSRLYVVLVATQSSYEPALRPGASDLAVRRQEVHVNTWVAADGSVIKSVASSDAAGCPRSV